ncbi:MAG: hypothetical protein QNJ91_15985 [Gammaproteobacteria bacterium]|nr:hypothetical protein [Gammaproteobacteria bacterium]
MADEIRQPGNIAQVQPSRRTRDSGARKRPRQPEQRRDNDARPKPRRDDGETHQVDEYV